MGGGIFLLNAVEEVFKFTNVESSEESERAATLSFTPCVYFVNVQAI
jgi:hypothetical protein